MRVVHISLKTYNFEDKKPNIINFISIDPDVQQSHIADSVIKYWNDKGLSVNKLDWKKDFSPTSKDYLLAKDLTDLSNETLDKDAIIIEFPPLRQNAIPKALLQKANLNLLLLDSNKSWKESNQLLFDEIKRLSENVPLMLLLTNANYKEIEDITGITPSNIIGQEENK